MFVAAAYRKIKVTGSKRPIHNKASRSINLFKHYTRGGVVIRLMTLVPVITRCGMSISFLLRHVLLHGKVIEALVVTSYEMSSPAIQDHQSMLIWKHGDKTDESLHCNQMVLCIFCNDQFSD